MSDINIRTSGHAGRITLTRPQALNAVSHEMLRAIEAALRDWASDDAVRVVVIDAEGEKAFSAGGDLQKMYDTASAGDFAYGRAFWRDEYRLNALIATYPKPYVALCQGFTMGGGVGVSLHGSHRIVGETSQIAMPEVGVGLVPDVGGSLLLARAPGFFGEYLGITGHRMGPGDAIWCNFADHFVPQAEWPGLIEELERTGEVDRILHWSEVPPEAPLMALRSRIETEFSRPTAAEILDRMEGDGWGTVTGKLIRAGSPLSVACTIELVRRARDTNDIRDALRQEFRFTWRSASDGDFIEGIRAAIVDKDKEPRWQHDSVYDVSPGAVAAMLSPLGPEELAL